MTSSGGFEAALHLRGGDDDLRSFVEGIVDALPFTAHMGIGVDHVEPGLARISLPGDDRFTNHLGTVHAIAELAPAETAGGVAITSAFPDLLEQGYVPIAKALRVQWTAPARGMLTATARLDPDEQVRMRAAAGRGDRVACTLWIPVMDGDDTTVAELEIDYVMRQLG